MYNFHLTECDTPLQLIGSSYCSGPQTDEMLPSEILTLFDKYPKVNVISMSTEKTARVWKRTETRTQKD